MISTLIQRYFNGSAWRSERTAPSTNPSILGLSRKNCLVFAGYLLVLCTAVSIYQPWEDEGRAWIIARDSSLTSMLFHMLRSEGHPALWYLILWLPAHLHMAYVHINWISASIAAAGIYVLLRYSPFPFYLRVLLPFGFALQYQYAVVARSYVLFPLLGFLVAHFYRNREKQPIALAIALAFFANISVHATLIALGLAVGIWLESRKSQRAAECRPSKRRDVRVAMLISTAGILFVAVCLWPPVTIQMKIVQRLSDTFSAQGNVISRVLRPHRSQGDQVGMTSIHQERSSFLHRTADTASRVLAFAVASYRPLAFFYEALIVLYLYRLRRLILLLPLLLLVGFLVFGYQRPWHLQMVWITLLLLLWMVWKDPVQKQVPKLQTTIGCMLALLCILQLSWTVGALRYERSNTMYPSRNAAQYLMTLPAGRRIAGRGRAITLLPYFSQLLFTEFSPYRAMDLLASHPDVIVGDSTMSAAEVSALSVARYRQTHSFCGYVYFPNETPAPLCLLIFEAAHR